MAKKNPNIVILYTDDLGYGDLSCYGAEDLHTPNVDAIADSGLRFTDAYSTASVCTPARFSLMTGRYPCRCEGINILPGDAKSIVTPDMCTLPQMLHDNGYHTGIVGKWHLGLGEGDQPTNWNEPISCTPLDVGFDECFIFPATADRVPCVYFDGRNVLNLDPEDPISVAYCKQNPFPGIPTGRDNPELLRLKATCGHDYSIVNGVGRIGYMRGGEKALWKDEDLAETFVNRAKKFVEDNKDQPFFLYYALHQPHVPRLPSPRFAGTTPLGTRGDVIAEMDWCVGELMDTLKKNNLLEDTIVIFSSDNGPVLDDGYDDHALDLNREHRPAGPLRGAKGSTFEGGIRIPFIVSQPGTIRRGVTAAKVSQVDLLASFASMLGAEIPVTDSENVLDALMGRDDSGREEVYAETPSGSGVLRQGKWVYITPSDEAPYCYYTHSETGCTRDHQLYNLQYDIGEQRNLAYVYPEIVEKMAKRIEEIRAKELN